MDGCGLQKSNYSRVPAIQLTSHTGSRFPEHSGIRVGGQHEERLPHRCLAHLAATGAARRPCMQAQEVLHLLHASTLQAIVKYSFGNRTLTCTKDGMNVLIADRLSYWVLMPGRLK